MSRLRLIILPLAVVAELSLLALAWMLAMVSPRSAEKVSRWSTERLPSLSWYLDRKPAKNQAGHE